MYISIYIYTDISSLYCFLFGRRRKKRKPINDSLQREMRAFTVQMCVCVTVSVILLMSMSKGQNRKVRPCCNTKLQQAKVPQRLLNMDFRRSRPSSTDQSSFSPQPGMIIMIIIAGIIIIVS